MNLANDDLITPIEYIKIRLNFERVEATIEV